MPPTVVVALGTNDQESPEQFASIVDQIMARLRGRRVVWINVAKAGDQALNDQLNASKSRYSNLEVLDWAWIIAAHPEDLLPDRIHCTQAGYQLRASVIAAAIEDQP
jgi:lysophospholipase L1-like esterase